MSLAMLFAAIIVTSNFQTNIFSFPTHDEKSQKCYRLTALFIHILTF